MHNVPLYQDHVTQQQSYESGRIPLSGDTMSKKLNALRTVFGHEFFKEKQEEAIDAMLSDTDCLIILPTGAGKTLCFAIPALIKGGVTLVISPLLSLMLNQVDNLRSKGLNVAYMNASVSMDDKNIIIHNMLLDCPAYNFVFVTPETAVTEDFQKILREMKQKGNLSFIVIDECHCVDMWGFDFRPAYAELGTLASLDCPIVALTATCSSRTEEVITSSLQLTNHKTIRQSCNRENISLSVIPKKGDGKEQVVFTILQNHRNDCGIVYCLKRTDTTDMCYLLQTKGISATYYHGALDPYKKKENVQAWVEGQSHVMCATIAFGMGIDKANVRFVIHLSLPHSMESYAQEFGRAGRDGDQSVACIFFRPEDRTGHMQMLSAVAESEHRGVKKQKLNEMVKFCVVPECRKVQLMRYFSEESERPCGNMCDICLNTQTFEAHNGNTQALELLSCLKGEVQPKTKI